MFWKLFLAFTVIPAVELYLIIRIGNWLGPFATVMMVLWSGVLGAYLAKREGFAVLRTVVSEAQQGFPSGTRIIEGVLVAVGAILLITPGVLTDLTGILIILPPVRRFLAPRLRDYALARLHIVRIGGEAPRPEPPPQAPPHKSPFDHPTL